MNTEAHSANARRGGRPSREEAGQIEDRILDAAAMLFFSEGYGTTSIEGIARGARISKRTFYARYENKQSIFSAVVHRLIQRLRPPEAATAQLFDGDRVSDVLGRIAPIIIKASLSPNALALHRVVMAEAIRFPELAMIVNEQSSRQEAIQRIGALLREKSSAKSDASTSFAAEQFLLMLTAGPQRRALGLGASLTSDELKDWAAQTVDLFLNGFEASSQ